ncbi:acyltransferase family protein [Ammoniphilus sp. 3BR4]|uniref:acyltransferase family protein n=1 Tax=Ammoniphilus sp. 3BR4 TaxID=3158265 RepID=UPI003467B5C8
MNKLNDKEIFACLFILQLVASFLVYVGHYTASLTHLTPPTLWESALNQTARYGTVLLAIITGFFTAHSLHGKKAKAAPYFKGKLYYILIPFLLAGVVYHKVLHGAWPHFQHHFENILLGNTGRHLYFVFMLFQYYVFAYLFRNLITKKTIYLFIPVFVVFQFLFIRGYSGWIDLNVRHFLPTWIFTIYTGHLLYWYRTQIITQLRRNKKLLSLLTLLFIGSWIYFVFSEQLFVANHLSFVFSSITLLVTAWVLLTQVIHKVHLRFQKGMTFYIFLSHSAFINFANKYFLYRYGYTDLLIQSKWFYLLYLGAIFVITLIFSYFLALIVNRLLSGNTRKENKSGRQSAAV